MRKLATISLISLLGIHLLAEPEIKGTAPELAQFINGLPKTVSVTGEAEVRVPANRAVLSLKVVTENRSLQEALRANAELRGKLAEYLKKQGITADRIQASKFSSTPKFGMFGEKAKSYRVENEMRISIQDEKEFQGATGAVDAWAEVQYDGVEFEYADKEAQKQNAIARACDNAGEQKKIYEDKFGLKLTPVIFEGGAAAQENTVPADSYTGRNRRAVGVTTLSGSSATAAEESVSSFGELVYTARVTVGYTVQPK